MAANDSTTTSDDNAQGVVRKVAKKTAAKKTARKVAKKSATAKKATARKTTAKKTVAKKAKAMKTAAKKTAAKKAASTQVDDVNVSDTANLKPGSSDGSAVQVRIRIAWVAESRSGITDGLNHGQAKRPIGVD